MATLEISGSNVKVVERHIRIYVRPGGSYLKFLKEWCNHFSSDSDHLQEELTHWEEWISNNNPPGHPYGK